MITYTRRQKNEIFAIEERGPKSEPFKVDISFTLIDWLKMDYVISQIKKEKQIELEQIDRLSMSFNILPRGVNYHLYLLIKLALDGDIVTLKASVKEIERCY